MKWNTKLLYRWLRYKSYKVARLAHLPNSWGKQEYGGKEYAAETHKKIDLNNLDQKRGWIQAYCSKFIFGMKVNKDEKRLKNDRPVIRYRELA